MIPPCEAARVLTVAMLSFRLGTLDGVSVVAGMWSTQLQALGCRVITVAGEGPVERCVPGLAIDAPAPPAAGELHDALADADVVVVENLLSIPLHLAASAVVAEVLRGRPAVVHHHDPPWQRARFRHVTALPVHDPAWRHVAVNGRTARELTERGFPAVRIWPALDVDAAPGDGGALRAELGLAGRPLLLHPVRAIERKAVPVALALAQAVGGVYWLTGPAEEGYGPELQRLLGATTAPVRRRRLAPAELADAYAAADAVLFPSTWEGLGLPPLEAAVWRRPVVVGPYPVAQELRSLGFRWLPADDPVALRRVLEDPAAVEDDLAVNQAVARRHFSFAALRDSLHTLFREAGWLP